MVSLIRIGLLLALVTTGIITLVAYSGTQHTVTVHDGNETIASFTVELATTPEQRYIGLSNHSSLDTGHGMFFVHEQPQNRTYVMRGMDFGIDIVFVDSDCQITTIHEAPAPGPTESGRDMHYSGYGQYVLEVPQETLSQTANKGDRVLLDGRCGIEE